MKQQSILVSGQARPMPRPYSSFSALHSAMCSSPHTPHGTRRRNLFSSASISRLDWPHSQLTTAPDALSAKTLRCWITRLWHAGQR